MKITKIGHCCMILEQDGVKLLTDPGVWSDLSTTDLKNISAVIITHEHADHYDSKAIELILKSSPNAKFISNSSVGKLLKQINIDCQIVEHGKPQILAA